MNIIHLDINLELVVLFLKHVLYRIILNNRVGQSYTQHKWTGQAVTVYYDRDKIADMNTKLVEAVVVEGIVTNIGYREYQ